MHSSEPECQNSYVNNLEVNNISFYFQVIQHLFNWQTPKIKPTEQDVINLLNTKFILRLDLDRKIIEHATSPDKEPQGDSQEQDSSSAAKKVKTQ